LERFDDEDSRHQAREQLQKLTFKQKSKTSNWTQRQKEEAEKRLKLEEEKAEKLRKEAEMKEELERQRKFQEEEERLRYISYLRCLRYY